MQRWFPALAAVLAAAACAPPPATAPAPFQAPDSIERPLPGPVVPPPAYQAAVAAGTRSPTGAPGPRYWQNRADYVIRARVDPVAKTLAGSEVITYVNNSPDALDRLHLDLTLNHHAPGVVRNEPAEVTGGVTITRVAVDGTPVTADGRDGPRYRIANTRMIVVPPRPVPAGGTVRIEVAWDYRIPQAGAGGRMGWSGDELLYLAYWFPQMAVYDDVVGWHPDPFLGTAEFYTDFGSWDYTVEAPAGWVVWGTGALQNPREVLAPEVLARMEAGVAADGVTRVLSADAYTGATTRGTDGTLRWRFRADSVRDAAFSVMRGFHWDATRSAVGDRDGDGRTDYTQIHAFWRPSAPRWQHVAAYQAHAIRFLSDYTGIAYPWPHMSAVEGEGIIGGGMEYPMMTLIGGYTQAGDAALYNVTAHELAHMWVPMIVGVDERRYSWMDEGMTTFHEAQARKDTFPGNPAEMQDRMQYLALARRGGEGEVMRRSDFHYDGGAYGTASYPKPATNFVTLRGVLGEATFQRAWTTFLDRWKYRHPLPWDFFATVEEVAGEDLDWFWQSWFYQTWTLDHAVESVTQGPGGATIVIRDRGDALMPVHVSVTRADGSVERIEIPVDVWRTGTRTATLTLDASATDAPITRVELDADNVFPDVDRENNVWAGS